MNITKLIKIINNKIKNDNNNRIKFLKFGNNILL